MQCAENFIETDDDTAVLAARHANRGKEMPTTLYGLVLASANEPALALEFTIVFICKLEFAKAA